MRSLAHSLVGIAAVAALNLACAEEAGSGRKHEEVRPELSGWLVLVYGFGGEEESANRDAALERLRVAVPRPDVETLVEMGAAGGGLQRYRLADGVWVEDGLPRDAWLASDAELVDFLVSSVERFPNRRIALIVRGRGYGIRGLGGAGQGRDGGVLSLPALVHGIGDGLAAIEREKLDLVALDASFTASVEATLGLVGKADAFVGWQGLRPRHGLALAGVAASDPTWVGEGLFEATRLLAESLGTTSDMTLSFVELEPLEGLPGAFAEIRRRLAGDTCPACLLRFAAAVPRPAAMPDLADSPHDVDLGSLVFLGLRATDGGTYPVLNTALFEGFKTIDDSLRAAVVVSAGDRDRDFLTEWSGLGGTAGLEIVNGISIHLPLLEADLDPEYEALPWMREWLETLRTTWAVTRAGPVPAYGYVGDLYRHRTLWYFLASPGSDYWFFQVQHRLRWGLQREDGSTLLLVDVRATSEREGSVWGAWFGEGLALEQDDAWSWTYFQRADPGARNAAVAPLIRIPFEYRGERSTAFEPIVMQVHLDWFDRPSTDSARYFRGGRDGWSEFAPEPGSRIRPLLRVLAVDGTEHFSPSVTEFDPGRPLVVRYREVDAGLPFRLSLQPHGPAGAGAEAVREGEM